MKTNVRTEPVVASARVSQFILGSVLILALLPVSCARKSDPQVLATVGLSEIRVDQFREQMARRAGARPEVLDKNALLEEMIDQEALFVRACSAGLDKDPELQRAWRNLVIGKLKERELASRIASAEVSVEELNAAYQRERERFTKPAAVRLAILVLKTDPVMTAETIAGIQNRMAEARQHALSAAAETGPGFGALAITCSEEQASRYNGGILGWVELNRGHAWLETQPIEAGFSLKRAGDISEVITGSKGVYLVKLLERREPTIVPLGQVEASLRQRLLVEKRLQIEREFIRASRESVQVQTHPELLALIPSTSRPDGADSKRPPAFP